MPQDYTRLGIWLVVQDPAEEVNVCVLHGLWFEEVMRHRLHACLPELGLHALDDAGHVLEHKLAPGFEPRQCLEQGFALVPYTAADINQLEPCVALEHLLPQTLCNREGLSPPLGVVAGDAGLHHLVKGIQEGLVRDQPVDEVLFGAQRVLAGPCEGVLRRSAPRLSQITGLKVDVAGGVSQIKTSTHKGKQTHGLRPVAPQRRDGQNSRHHQRPQNPDDKQGISMRGRPKLLARELLLSGAVDEIEDAHGLLEGRGELLAGLQYLPSLLVGSRRLSGKEIRNLRDGSSESSEIHGCRIVVISKLRQGDLLAEEPKGLVGDAGRGGQHTMRGHGRVQTRRGPGLAGGRLVVVDDGSDAVSLVPSEKVTVTDSRWAWLTMDTSRFS
ncbi:hypothetical protein ASPVEDRAFT_890120 [Aspergillus versicolor CBS 583.65]|uniref:Uncharacterized protein n=1 Tax=Aspergillus versicolor CBS 583.65 TaxID=1036611 RepID=A0A1L9PPG9_ASPVE|nr:uncharacterized protein ASPVEDRAFT_890120 [Aspergillus versicolor CBS 583.65]OJJ03393.1 hypothetical protein ASPVEDRAFT_890120 [Aspergillus versicolor CBS 583.65]